MPKSSGGHRDPIPLLQKLSSNGDGTGTTSAIGDYSVTPLTIFIAPIAGEVYVIDKLVVHIADNGSFVRSGYGAGAALTNGVQIQVSDSSGVLYSLLSGSPVIDNEGWMHVGEFDREQFSASEDSVSVSLIPATNIILDGSQGHKLEVILNDNFSTLPDQHFIAHGYK